MITGRQKWFIFKLINELESLGFTDVDRLTRYAGVQFDNYRMTSKDASKDIEMLLFFKNQLENGSTPTEAYNNYVGA